MGGPMNGRRSATGLIERVAAHTTTPAAVSGDDAAAGAPSVTDPEPVRGRAARLRRRLSSRRASRLVALLVVLTIVPLIALSTISTRSTYHTLSGAARDRLTDDSTLVGMFIATQLIFQGMQIEAAYAGRPAMVAALGDGNHAHFDKAAITATLTDLRYLVPTIQSAFITDAAGTFWGDADTPVTVGPNGQDLSAQDWYQGIKRTGKPYVSTGFLSTGPKPQMQVAIATPIIADGRNAAKGTVLGVLAAYYPQTTPKSLFVGSPGQHPIDVQVTDQQGAIISSSFGTPATLERDTSAGVTDALRGKYSTHQIRIDGKEYFASYAPIPFIGWTMRATVPASVALSDANRLLVLVAVITVVLVALIALSKLILYVVLRDLQGARAELATANATLEKRVAARTAALEASNKELESFTFSVSHDLRTPLRSIDGFSRILQEESAAELSPESQRLLGKVRAGAQQMAILIDELLGFSRLSHIEVRKQRFAPNPIVDEIIADLREENPDRNLEFTVLPLPDCQADRTLFAQLVRNLLGNSVKFTEPKPLAHIEIGTTGTTDPADEGRLVFYVKDDGVGFDMQYVGKLFTPFQRLHREDEFVGTGVGLALVRRIVERHGGRVWAEGTVGEGATFYFTLEEADD